MQFAKSIVAFLRITSKHHFDEKRCCIQTLNRYIMSSVNQTNKGNMLEEQIMLGAATKVRTNPIIKRLDTKEFRAIFSPELEILIKIFRNYNYELRIAGGAVRDILMSLIPKDLDFATTATPEQMKQMFSKEQIRMINTKGEKHGTITARINDKSNFEVTTLRIDTKTNGRHAEVMFTTNWQLDANRRDLTINSMFLDLEGNVYDYFFGYDDLMERRVVFVGDPNVRIREDYLRILRYFRFYGRIAEHSCQHDKQTLQAIKDNAAGLAGISGERIWSELQKILSGNYAMEIVLQMIDCNLAEYCGLPAKPNLKEFKRLCQPNDYQIEFPPVLLITSLLHCEQDAIRLHDRLKLSANERDLIYFLMQQNYQDKIYQTLNDYQKLCFQANIKRQFVEELLKYRHQMDLYHALRNWQIPQFPINGKDLLKRNVPAGRQMSNILMQLKLIWADSDFQLTSEELLNHHLPIVQKSLQFSTTNAKHQKLQV